MSGIGDISGLSLLDLFKLEAEAHCTALNDGLLSLERSSGTAPPGQSIEPLMPAAHSVKGAARIVGLDVIVTLAHAMEDRLIAAQKGTAPLTPAHIDQLLKCVDVLNEVRGLAEQDLPAWMSA